MPTISFFYGIAIQMYYADQPPPHRHARYNEHRARFDIVSGIMMSGSMPRQARRLIEEWIALNTEALQMNWARMERGEQMERIEGLQ